MIVPAPNQSYGDTHATVPVRLSGWRLPSGQDVDIGGFPEGRRQQASAGRDQLREV